MTHYVGQSVPRVDAIAKVTGEADFPGDLTMPGMLHMKVLFANRPHAHILNIDTSQAEAAPGVVAVLTAQDVPVNSYGIGVYDQPVLCDQVVRFVGDRVALIVAETEKAAARARDLIVVEYEDRPALDSPEAALAPNAPVLHPGMDSNVLTNYRIRKGDVEAGFAQADVIVEETYTLGGQEHAYLQPDAGLAWVDDDGCVVVKSTGQWAHDDQRQIAHCLDLPEDQVRVQYVFAGGAFGGREDVSVHILLALAAVKTGQPVKVVWTRGETMIGHHKRHAMTIRHKWGTTKEGKLIAQETEVVSDAGAYTSTSDYVLASTVLLSTGPYEVPHVKLDAMAVFTNNVTGGAFRGFGVPQALVTAESQMARLAEALNIDPVQLRMINVLREGSQTGTMVEVPPGLSAEETLEAAASAAGWEKKQGKWSRPSAAKEVRPGMLRGLGIAAGWKNVAYTLGYPEQSTATIELYGGAEVEQAVVRLPAAEVGQGIQTTLHQMAAEALSLPMEKVEIVAIDTATTASSGSVSASRMAMMAGNALIGAAQAAYAEWQNEERPAVATYHYIAPPTESLDPVTGQGKGAFVFAYLAQAVELEVDTETGQITVTRIVSAHDVGKAINPVVVEGQIGGGAIQALGWSTMENFVMDQGRVLTPDFSTYLIPTTLDIPPDFESLILENPLPIGPWGATGVGEMPFLAIAPAIMDALHDATGVWFNHLPLTPESILEGLSG
jgi:CO/xanthine dehydrogenase Mo-binding subunit